jgi:hypothetical protein
MADDKAEQRRIDQLRRNVEEARQRQIRELKEAEKRGKR